MFYMLDGAMPFKKALRTHLRINRIFPTPSILALLIWYIGTLTTGSFYRSCLWRRHGTSSSFKRKNDLIFGIHCCFKLQIAAEYAAMYFKHVIGEMEYRLNKFCDWTNIYFSYFFYIDSIISRADRNFK